jgi:CheY-like chemotaxis protein
MIHVLYLDDEPHNLSAFQAAFRRDFRVHTTTEPTDAVALLREHPVEVLISDQKMPNISGVEFFELIMNDGTRTVLQVAAAI